MKVQYVIYFNCNSVVVYIFDKKIECFINDVYMYVIFDV